MSALSAALTVSSIGEELPSPHSSTDSLDDVSTIDGVAGYTGRTSPLRKPVLDTPAEPPALTSPGGSAALAAVASVASGGGDDLPPTADNTSMQAVRQLLSEKHVVRDAEGRERLAGTEKGGGRISS